MMSGCGHYSRSSCAVEGQPSGLVASGSRDGPRCMDWGSHKPKVSQDMLNNKRVVRRMPVSGSTPLRSRVLERAGVPCSPRYRLL